MKGVLAFIVLASTVLASCGSTAPPAVWKVVLTLSDDMTETVLVKDDAGIVEGIAPVGADQDYERDKKNGLAVTNPDGDLTRLIVTWLGGNCRETNINLTVAPAASGFAISVQEPRSLQTCGSAVGAVKAIEIKLRAPVPEASITGTLIAPCADVSCPD